MAQSKKPPAVCAGENGPDPRRNLAGGPQPDPSPGSLPARSATSCLAARDRETILLALQLAGDFVASLLDTETIDGTRLAPGHPLRPDVERWHEQRKRIAELEARLAERWREDT